MIQGLSRFLLPLEISFGCKVKRVDGFPKQTSALVKGRLTFDLSQLHLLLLQSSFTELSCGFLVVFLYYSPTPQLLLVDPLAIPFCFSLVANFGLELQS
ncbi:hypothetical protein K1719_025070 [Acacia pycnantha]|nr:hypothetical protein K1719_025070 [Acacia pycnantha]